MDFPAPPEIKTDLLSGEEQDNAWHLDFLLRDLDSYIHRFEAAVALIERCTADLRHWIPRTAGADYVPEYPLLSDAELALRWGWQAMAARDATMTIYHFGSTLTSIGKAVGKCPTLLPFHDAARAKEAKRLFKEYFPAAEKARHAIGHAADIKSSRDKLMGHAYSGDMNNDLVSGTVGGMIMSGNIINANLWMTFEGELIQVAVNRSSLEKLTNCLRLTFEAFAPVAAETFARSRRAEVLAVARRRRKKAQTSAR